MVLILLSGGVDIFVWSMIFFLILVKSKGPSEKIIKASAKGYEKSDQKSLKSYT